MPPISSETPTDGSHFEPAAADQLAAALPYLRRYARSATGSQTTGDALVRATLEAALADPEFRSQISSGVVALFKAFSAIWISVDPQADRSPALSHLAESQLARIPTVRRQALLLNQLEDFSLAQTGKILGVSEEEANELVNAALDDIANEPAAQVLIVEDEPMIADHLAAIVTQSGHEIVGYATTAAEARTAFERFKPTLVLSDVQLADGSSGVDAVDDMQRQWPVPVIFITGFPQKLLTGSGHEPAFLITKPFREDTVRTTISQALFFGASLVD